MGKLIILTQILRVGRFAFSYFFGHLILDQLMRYRTDTLVLIITCVRPEDKQALEISQGAVNPIIHLIFASCSAILVCGPLGKYN